MRTLCYSLAVALAVTVSAGVFGACSSSPASSSSSMDAKPVLVDLTNNVILPSYRALDTQVDALRAAAAELQASPSDASLSKAQAAWRAARKAWEQAEAFRFGPVESNRITPAMNYWPAGADAIGKVIAGTDPITAESFEALGANAKGSLAVEYLLFDNQGGNAAVLTSLTTAPNADRRLTYVKVATENMKKRTAELVSAWDPAGQNFAKELTDAGDLFPTSKAALDQIVNSATFAADLVTGTKIAKPYGLKTGGVPAPDQEETPRSDNSIADMLATVDGVRSVYTGAYGSADGMGLSDLVRAKNPALDDRVIADLADAEAKIGAIPAPFRTAITDHREAVEAAYQSIRTLKNSLTTEVAGTLGTTLKFNDNDGD
ncbi:Iron-regulated protein A precursor [Labilithrix luteola]|uniref:Iron-regulated protein A n=1 Tax=Labilithrix luteola TaxID=1391654 RepID=A0A0K1QB93_9BACT|nr:imelysin family protein [Labilithrix luteola]AKV03014.1 Iron-regulated protein A precursor [Labilithrix luteola]